MTPSAEVMLAEPAALIDDTTITGFIEHQNLAYVLYTIGDRAIPSAVDGLKPGQRRVLYQMFVDKITPDAKPRKSSKVASATTGALHPHGHTAMYGTMVTMAAPYRRTRFIEGVGSFGQSPGDTPAADRYTEVRLSEPGHAMVKEMSDHAVPMVPSYDNETVEPVHLPVQFPAVLVGGAEGMAEGYATKIPAHNPREVIDLCRAYLSSPDMSVAEMREIMPGPDWGTGGIVVGDQSVIDDYYATGRGKMRVRCVHHIEGKDVIITQVPPGIGVPTLLSDIRSKATEGIIPGIADVTNLTDLDHGLRIVITAKRGTKPEDLVEALLSETDLETTYAASMVALDRGKVPKWWSMGELISEFLTMRDEVIVTRSEHKLTKVNEALQRARAVAAVALDKERASRIILDSENKDTAAVEISQGFDLDEEQGVYIVSMPLYRLTKADALAAVKKVEELEAEAKKLQRLISSPAARIKVIDSELAETAKLFSADEYDRRTVLDSTLTPVGGSGPAGEVDPAEQLTRWKFDPDAGVLGDSGESIALGQQVWAVFNSGKVKTFQGGNLPKRITVTPIAPDVSDLLACGLLVPETHSILFVTKLGKVLRIDPAALNPQGIAGTGVAGIKIGQDDALAGAMVASEDDVLLTVSELGYKATAVSDIPVKGRGGQGVGVHTLRTKDSGLIHVDVAKAFTVNGAPVKVFPRPKAPVNKRPESWEREEG